MSAAERSSEGGTRSHPRGGLYVFVPCSQFSKGDGGGDRDERVQGNKRERVLEPPRVDTRRGSPLPVRVEGIFESTGDFGILNENSDLAVLGGRPEGPVHAGNEDHF